MAHRNPCQNGPFFRHKNPEYRGEPISAAKLIHEMTRMGKNPHGLTCWRQDGTLVILDAETTWFFSLDEFNERIRSRVEAKQHARRVASMQRKERRRLVEAHHEFLHLGSPLHI